MQGLKKSPLRTNLLPKEIVQDRLVNSKKPWAIASAAMVLLACTITFVSQVRGWSSVRKDKFQAAETAAKSVTTKATQYESDAKKALADFQATDKVGVNVVESVEGRLRWLELLKAINACLPTDPSGDEIQKIMKTPVSLKVQGVPLNTALESFGQSAGIKISFDSAGLKEAGVGEDKPISIELPPNVSLRNALDQILPPMWLGYVIGIRGDITITSLATAISERNQLHIRAIDCQRMDSFEVWIGQMKQRGWYNPKEKEWQEDKKADPALEEA